MKRLVVVVMICCFLVDCRKRNYRIDLEIDPIDRWKEVIKDYKEQFNEVLDEVVKSNQNPILETVMEYMVDYFALPNLPKDYQDELRGIALVSGRRLDEVLLFNIIYDLTSSHFLPKYGDKEDVSVIAGGQNNTIFHGTNLINMFSPKSQQHILTIEFYQNKNLLFKSNHIPGFIGTITAYKPNHFSISLNLKKEGNDVDNLLSLTSGNFHSIPLTIRKVFEVANSFERAILFLSNTNFIAPSFVTIGGINSTQGAIITRSRNETSYVQYLDGSAFICAGSFDLLRCRDKFGFSNNVTGDVLYEALSTNETNVTTFVMSGGDEEVNDNFFKVNEFIENNVDGVVKDDLIFAILNNNGSN